MSKIDTTRVLMEFIRAAVTGTELSNVAKSVDDETLKNVFGLAQKHDLSQLVADVLLKNKVSENDELLNVCRQVSLMALIRYQQQTYEFNRICNLFEDNSIPFIPLKGAVIRDYYPEPWMRSSCDIDILVRQDNLETICNLLTADCKYSFFKKTTHDVIFTTEGGVHIELHFKLIDDDVKRNGEYLRKWNAECLTDVWNHACVADGAKCRYILNDEIMYFYHIAHMAKHFETGGCGIKPFVDLWLINNKAKYDSVKRKEVLQEGNLLEFAENVNKLSEVWFEGKEPNATTDMIEHYIITGGVYGTVKNKVVFAQSKTGSRFKHIMSRLFVSYDVLCLHFPILLRHKWLIPFCQVARWFKIVFRNGLISSAAELGINDKATDDAQVSMKELIENLGL